MMGTGREAAVPSEAPSIQNHTAPTPPALHSTLFNLKPQALPPPDLGQFLKGCALSILKDHFSSSTRVSQKQIVTTHYPPKFN